MDVLILAQYFPPDMGGGATRASNAARGLVEAGCNVTVVAAHPHYPKGDIPRKYNWKPLVVENKDYLRVIRTFVPPLESKGLVRRIFLFLSFMISSLFALPLVGKVDVIWAANPNILAMFPASLFRRIKGCRVVQNVDDLWPEALFDLGISESSLYGRLGKMLAGIAYSLADGITPISPGYVDTIVRSYGISPSQIAVIRAGVDVERFKKLKTSMKSGLFRVLYIGVFSPAYDFDQIFDAAVILEGREDIEFIIQGGGEIADFLKQKVSKMSTRNITLIEKIVSRDQVASILQTADALILPLCGTGSIEMGISSKLYEYQAAEKPIICCSNGQPGRFVEKTASGIVVPPGNSAALSTAILTLVDNRDIADQYAKNGRRYVELHMRTESIGKDMKNFFNWIL